jgi:hypothetical protein
MDHILGDGPNGNYTMKVNNGPNLMIVNNGQYTIIVILNKRVCLPAESLRILENIVLLSPWYISETIRV